MGRDGAQLHAGAARAMLPALLDATRGLPERAAGTRIHGIPAIGMLLRGDVLCEIARDAIGAGAQPVRAILFDKSAATNWALGWHQDRTIAVRARAEAPGFGPWTVKQGIVHVAPPFALLERMVTLRIHLDPVPEGNAPLLVARASHRLGLVRDAEATQVAEACGVFACLAEPGDVWAYATPVLHASARASTPTRRRVLQVDYAAEALPAELSWLGV